MLSHSGTVQKLSSNSLVGYQKRFLILEDNRLEYFRQASDSEACGTIELGMAQVRVDGKKMFILSDNREYLFKMENPKEAETWFNKIKQICPVYHQPVDQSSSSKNGKMFGSLSKRLSLNRERASIAKSSNNDEKDDWSVPSEKTRSATVTVTPTASTTSRSSLDLDGSKSQQKDNVKEESKVKTLKEDVVAEKLPVVETIKDGNGAKQVTEVVKEKQEKVGEECKGQVEKLRLQSHHEKDENANADDDIEKYVAESSIQAHVEAFGDKTSTPVSASQLQERNEQEKGLEPIKNTKVVKKAPGFSFKSLFCGICSSKALDDDDAESLD